MSDTDEITRLRAENERLTRQFAEHADRTADDTAALRAENERLKEEAEFNYMAGFDVARNQYCKMVQELEDENERLRAALEELLACPAIADGNHNDPAWACHETAAAETFARKVLARAALEGRT